MRARNGLIAGALAVAILATGAVPAPFGAGVAEAKDYYTRKRVNGKWITGRFPKRSAQEAKARDKAPREEPEASAPTAPAASVAQAAPRTAPAPAGPNPPPSATAPVQTDPLLPLKMALEQKARTMATGVPAPAVKTVTYDFDHGRRTVTYMDGSVKVEPLDAVATGQTTPKR